ncbi:kinase-like domain-containing protein, partial [Endogone sp. FLAS-F59071]
MYSSNKHHVAIKIMNIKYNEIGVQESKKLRYLHSTQTSSPGIPLVQLVTTFTFGPHFCLVLEPLHGGHLSLAKSFIHLRNISPSSSSLTPAAVWHETEHQCLQAARKIAAQLLTSLEFLKRMRIIHADLKPENILKVD